MKLKDKFFVKHSPIPTKPGCWDYTLVEIFERNEDGVENKIGEYTRNYSSFYDTFYPFIQNVKYYALVSIHYEGVSVIELPSCKVIASYNDGFCPVDFFVPFDEEYYTKQDYNKPKFNGMFGFVSGCVWGDDSLAWKLRYLDLSKIEKGIIIQEDKFGYHMLPSGRLCDIIDMSCYEIDNPTIGLPSIEFYDLELDFNK
jgi:hypothetical protein